MNYPSQIQQTQTYAAYNSNGNGTNVFPVITYADVCFMRAELAAGGLSSDPLTPAQLYYNGITASITNYDHWGKTTQLPDYTPLGSNEITNYLAQPGVVFDPTHAIEQICVQEYLNFYINPNETWALIKRTGYPSATGAIMPLEDVSTYGAMPRRYSASYPSLGDLNFNNATQAIDDMRKDPSYGDPSDITGHVWWDAP